MNNIKERIKQQHKCNMLIQSQIRLHDSMALATGQHYEDLAEHWQLMQDKINVLLEDLSNE